MGVQMTRVYYSKYHGQDGHPTSALVVSSVRVTDGPGHGRIEVWNRGGKAGELVVDRRDTERLLDMLLPLHLRRTGESYD